MSDTYTTPFVFHDLPPDLFQIADHFNFTCDFLDFNLTDTNAFVFDLTFKSPIDLDLFTRYYNGELGLYWEKIMTQLMFAPGWFQQINTTAEEDEKRDQTLIVS